MFRRHRPIWIKGSQKRKEGGGRKETERKDNRYSILSLNSNPIVGTRKSGERLLKSPSEKFSCLLLLLVDS